MNITRSKLETTYSEVLAEFNGSNFARKSGTTLSPSPLHLVEAEQILARLPDGGNFLDVGTGYGLIPHLMQRFGAKVISVDSRTTAGEEALGRLIPLGIQGHFVHVGDESIPIPDESIDVVFAGNVIEHQIHSPKRFMQDLWRILKYEGHIVIDTKNAVDLKTRLKVLFGISNWPTLDGIFSHEFNIYHHKEYTLRELTRLLEMSGFNDVEGAAIEIFFHKSLKRFGTLRAMGAKLEELSEFGTGFNYRHPYEYARLIFLTTTYLFPNMRSDILATGRKTRLAAVE
jgi:ubiquinone/menaquinone biosynthesis C-methylase UbiE